MYFGVVPAALVFAPFKLLFGVSLPAYHATQLFVALYVVGQFARFGSRVLDTPMDRVGHLTLPPLPPTGMARDERRAR